MRERRAPKVARRLGLRLPEFPGPLCAFEAVPIGHHEPRLYLGGDLHAVHPDSVEPPVSDGPDPSLDAATIVVDDLEHESHWATAEEGTWCVAVGAGMAASAPYFSLFDAKGRLRHWLILPPIRQMLGIAHLWLPFVRPWPGTERPLPEHPALRQRPRR